MWSCGNLWLAPVSAAMGVFLTLRRLFAHVHPGVLRQTLSKVNVAFAFEISRKAFGSGFYPERRENTSTESIIFKCASTVASRFRDRPAETEVYPAVLYQRPF